MKVQQYKMCPTCQGGKKKTIDSETGKTIRCTNNCKKGLLPLDHIKKSPIQKAIIPDIQ